MILLNKPKYLTSFQTIQKFQKENPDYADCKLGYVGTLDPMATGLLIVLKNEENKQRKNYIGLTKTYEFEILFGISTDSNDLLGIIDQIDINHSTKTEELNFSQFEGKYQQKYPLFSAKIAPTYAFAFRRALLIAGRKSISSVKRCVPSASSKGVIASLSSVPMIIQQRAYQRF